MLFTRGSQPPLIRSPPCSELNSAPPRALRPGLAQGKYVVFCTGDRQVAHVTTEWLQRARALFEQNPRLGLIGSQAGRIEGEVVQADAVRTQNGLFFVGEVAGGPVVIRRAALLNERVLSMARWAAPPEDARPCFCVL